MQTEIPIVSRIIHNLRRRARSKYSRICVLIPESPEAVKAGCSFKNLPPSRRTLCQQISDTYSSSKLSSREPKVVFVGTDIKRLIFIRLRKGNHSTHTVPDYWVTPKGNPFPICLGIFHSRLKATDNELGPGGPGPDLTIRPHIRR